MGQGMGEDIDQVIVLGSAILVAVLGIPALVYFGLSGVFEESISNLLAMAVSLLAALVVLLVLKRDIS